MPRLIALYPISGEDTMALPVKALDPAIAFYRDVLGFDVVQRDDDRVVLSRDDVRIGLVSQEDHDSGRAGSVAIRVDELEGLHRELERTGGRPGEFGEDEWGGQVHRTFFLREDENGYCFCFFRPV